MRFAIITEKETEKKRKRGKSEKQRGLAANKEKNERIGECMCMLCV